MFRKVLLFLGLSASTIIGIFLILGAKAINEWIGYDISGWVQAGIVVISFPIILYELNKIQQTVTRKPSLELGIVNVKGFPFSKVRALSEFPKHISVNTGYPHFYIILRNRGSGPARYVKVYIEHSNREQGVFPAPLVKVSEFSENKPSFVHEHNFDFVFRAGIDWIINPDDIEPFGFHVTTSELREETNSAGVKYTVAQFPPKCEVILDCTVWAEGLDSPLRQTLSLDVIEYQNS